MNNKIKTADEAVALIADGDTVATGGFVGIGVPEGLLTALQKRYLDSRHPRDLTLVYAAGQGDGKERGLNHLGEAGLVKRIVGGHWGLVPRLGKLALENQCEAYNLPQGVISHLYRDIAAGKPGTLTHVGLKTFVDPRVDGGKLNRAACQDLVQVMEINGKECLFYQGFPINIALLRGTTADRKGNITMEREALTLEALSIAQAVHNSGGQVVVQVERVVDQNPLHPQMVKIPGILVDAVVVAEPQDHMQTFSEQYNPAYCGEQILQREAMQFDLDLRLLMGRIAARYLRPGAVVNLGIGMPEAVAMAASETGLIDQICLTVEPGGVGGIPSSGLSFGATANADAIVDQTAQFDLYDGGGINQAFLGMAEVDRLGNVNVSRFASRTAGAGGFINISQNAGEVFFMGSFCSGQQEIEITTEGLNIIRNGPVHKFVEQVQHLTFSGSYAIERGQPVRYVTERAVFRLEEQGLVLEMITPGVDLQKDILDLMAFKPAVPESIELFDLSLFQR